VAQSDQVAGGGAAGRDVVGQDAVQRLADHVVVDQHEGDTGRGELADAVVGDVAAAETPARSATSRSVTSRAIGTESIAEVQRPSSRHLQCLLSHPEPRRPRPSLPGGGTASVRGPAVTPTLAPSFGGVYRETFAPVIDGVAWMNHEVALTVVVGR
jgi:hypothetical protein